MTFDNINQQTFDELRSRLLNDHGATVISEPEPKGSLVQRGSISGHGVEANYDYHRDSRTLFVSISRHPFFIPTSSIYEELQRKISECFCSPRPAQTK